MLVLLLFVSNESLAAKYTITIGSTRLDQIQVWEGDSLSECLAHLDKCEAVLRYLEAAGMVMPRSDARLVVDIPDVWSLSLRELTLFANYPFYRGRRLPVYLQAKRNPCIYGRHMVGSSEECNCFGTGDLLSALGEANDLELPREEWTHCAAPPTRFAWMNIVLDYLDWDVLTRPLHYPGNFLIRDSFFDPEGALIWIQQCANRINRDLVPILIDSMSSEMSCSTRPARRSLDWLLNPDSTMQPLNTASLLYYLTVGRRGQGPFKWLRGWGYQPFTPGLKFPPPPPPPSALQ